MSQILPDPYVVEEEIPLQVAQDVTAFDVKALAVPVFSDYSAKISQKNKSTVMRVAWALPVARVGIGSAGASEVVGDARGRLVTPLGYSVRATNVSQDRLLWHVNTPYQEGNVDGIIATRVGDKVVELRPGVTRVHSHAWGNGAHFFPLRGLLAVNEKGDDSNICCAIADMFFLRDKYGSSNALIQSERDMVRVEVSVKYHMDRANSVDTDRIESRKAIKLVDLSVFDALYHVDPMPVTASGIASPVFTTPITKELYISVAAGPGSSVKLVSNTVDGSNTNVEAFHGVSDAVGTFVTVLALNVTYKDRDQNTHILSTFRKEDGVYKLVGTDGKPAGWVETLNKFRAPSFSPCLAYRQLTLSGAKIARLGGGRYARDMTPYGAIPWPSVANFALQVGTRILSMLAPGMGAGSKPTTHRSKKGGRKKRVVAKVTRQRR